MLTLSMPWCVPWELWPRTPLLWPLFTIPRLLTFPRSWWRIMMYWWIISSQTPRSSSATALSLNPLASFGPGWLQKRYVFRGINITLYTVYLCYLIKHQRSQISGSQLAFSVVFSSQSWSQELMLYPTYQFLSLLKVFVAGCEVTYITNFTKLTRII